MKLLPYPLKTSTYFSYWTSLSLVKINRYLKLAWARMTFQVVRMLLDYSCNVLLTLVLRLTLEYTFYAESFHFAPILVYDLSSGYYDPVIPRQHLLNKLLHCVPFHYSFCASSAFCKATAYEFNIYFGQYYNCQTFSVQYGRLSDLLRKSYWTALWIQVLTVIPSEYA